MIFHAQFWLAVIALALAACLSGCDKTQSRSAPISIKAPDVFKIKEDLIGRKMDFTKLKDCEFTSWSFAAPSEFIDLYIKNQSKTRNTVEYSLEAQLQEIGTDARYLSQFVVTYKRDEDEWQFISCVPKSFIQVAGAKSEDESIADKKKSLENETTSTAKPEDTVSSVPQSTSASEPIVPPTFVVRPGEYYYKSFIIPGDWTKGVVTGRFRAMGGDGNDIQVLITDEDGLENLMNGHKGRVWYSSDKTTVDTIKVTLSPGTYYLIFNNRFSLLSNKVINAEVELERL